MPQDALLTAAPLPQRKLLFVGDSVTCGAGVDNNPQCKEDPMHPANDAYHSFGMELGRRLDAQVQLVCYGGRGVTRDYRGLGIADGVLNAPEFLDLSIATDDPELRSEWKSQGWTPDAVLVSLGTNDFNLQATKPLDGEPFVHAWIALLNQIAEQHPEAKIFATEGAIVTDPLLRQYIRTAVDAVHQQRVQWLQATHYPGNGCNAHPTREQHLHMADDIEPVLRERLHW